MVGGVTLLLSAQGYPLALGAFAPWLLKCGFGFRVWGLGDAD